MEAVHPLGVGVVIGSSGKKKKKVDEDVAASTLSSFMMGDMIYVVPIVKSGQLFLALLQMISYVR